MASVGSWEVKVSTSGMPQKIAEAFGRLGDLVGAEYQFVAYLGSQLVNGTNHAVLAEQTVITGKDVKNVALIILRETKEGVTITNIERVIESGDELGGIKVDVTTDIPEEAQAAYDKTMEGHVGVSIKPFAFLATQVTEGTEYTFAAEISKVVRDPEPATVGLVTVNPMTKTVTVVPDILNKKQDEDGRLGYAFTWFRKK